MYILNILSGPLNFPDDKYCTQSMQHFLKSNDPYWTVRHSDDSHINLKELISNKFSYYFTQNHTQIA